MFHEKSQPITRPCSWVNKQLQMLFALRLWSKRQFLRAIQARLVKLPAKGLAKSGHWFIAQHSALWAQTCRSLRDESRSALRTSAAFRCMAAVEH